MVMHARFDGKVLVPVEPVDLPMDRVLELDVRESSDPPLGSGAAILEALRSLPPLEPGDTEAMMHEIEAGQQPPESKGVFDDLIGDSE